MILYKIYVIIYVMNFEVMKNVVCMLSEMHDLPESEKMA